MLALRRLRHGAVALGAVLLVTACTDESTGTAQPAPSVADTSPAGSTTAPGAPASTQAPATSDAAVSTAPVADVPEILQFTAPLVGGGTFDGAAYGGTPLALWFWAPG